MLEDLLDQAVKDAGTSWEEIEHDDVILFLPDGTKVGVGMEDCGGDGHSYWATFWASHGEITEFFRKDGYHDPGLTEYYDGLIPVHSTEVQGFHWKEK